MGTTPPQQPQPPRFSPDGNWFWTGSEWTAAISPDRRWRWTGYQWVPNQPARGGGGAGAAAGITVAVVLGAVGVVVLVGFIVIVLLLVMGNQISNVFSNVQAALGT